MSAHQIEQWMRAMGDYGDILGFLLPFLESFIPILPMFVFVFVNVDTFGLFLGIIISWLGTFLGSFVVFLIIRYFANTKFMDKVKERKEVQKFLGFVNHQGVTPIFIFFVLSIHPKFFNECGGWLVSNETSDFFHYISCFKFDCDGLNRYFRQRNA